MNGEPKHAELGPTMTGASGGVDEQSKYEKPFGSVVLEVSGFVTTTSNVPAAWGGTVIWISVGVMDVTLAETLPIDTVAPASGASRPSASIDG